MVNPRIVVVIVNWNQKRLTVECLKSLRRIKYPNYEVFLVDNRSADGTCEIIKKRFTGINLISLNENIGYGAACNIGMKIALEQDDVKYVYLSNNDVVFDRYFLSELVKVAECDDRIGIVGPIVYFYDTPNVIQGFGGHFNLRTGGITHFRSCPIDSNLSRKMRETDFIIGGCLLIKREAIEKVGYFDPQYFMYSEEIDYEYRVKKVGYKLAVVSTAKVWHKVYGSYGGKLSPSAVFYMSRNRIYFMRKHMSNFGLLYFFIYQLIYKIPLITLTYIKNRQFHLLQPYLKGIWKGIVDKIKRCKDSIDHQKE